jgi:hypothetical protein
LLAAGAGSRVGAATGAEATTGAGYETGVGLGAVAQAINKTPVKNNPDFLTILFMYILLLFEL